MKLISSIAHSIIRNVGVVAFGGVLTASLSLNVILLLRQQPISRTGGFRDGTIFPALTTKSLEGADEPIRFDRQTVLYMFSPTCDYCRRDYRNLLAVHAAAKERYEFVAVTTFSRPNAVRVYLRDLPFPGKVFLIDSAGLSEERQIDVGSTPQLLVVEPGGVIQKAWVGAMTDGRQREIEQFFGIRLPGLAPANDITQLLEPRSVTL